MEIEAKLPVADHDAVRAALKKAKARRIGAVLETNYILDDAGKTLQKAGKGLRVRINHDLATGRETVVLTVKGPLLQGALKVRQETEIVPDDAGRSLKFFADLGYAPVIAFEKKRETFTLGKCSIELDELPNIGKFVEIEGPSVSAVKRVQKQLGLGNLATVKTSYVAMIADWIEKTGGQGKLVKFATKSTGRRSTRQK